MIEIRVYNETFAVCTDCLNKDAINNILNIANRCSIDFEIGNASIIFKGKYENLFNALFLLASGYSILLD